MTHESRPLNTDLLSQASAFLEKLADDGTQEEIDALKKTLETLARDPTLGTLISTEFTAEEQERFRNLTNCKVGNSYYNTYDVQVDEVAAQWNFKDSVDILFEGKWEMTLFNPKFSQLVSGGKISDERSGADFAKSLRGYFFQEAEFDGSLKIRLNKEDALLEIVSPTWFLVKVTSTS